jgi:peptidoglycan/xylan/chitin deacetylase (PgdA/CDA1 family)
MGSLKRHLLRLMAAPAVAGSFAALTRGCATIFMLHRFREPARGIQGDDPGVLKHVLSYLRKHRYQLVSAADVVARLKAREPLLRRAVAFTIDDGYAEQADQAALFAEFDCPVTTFVATGFLDCLIWFWWDRIEYAFEHTRRRKVTVELHSTELNYHWQHPAQLASVQEDFTRRCKRVPDVEKNAAIDRLAAALEVEIPQQAPDRYTPMSWDQLRACERMGMTFGPHTVTHPVLSQVSDAVASREIGDSWLRLRAEAASPVPVFCYPNGQTGDFGEREFRILAKLGMQGAVVSTPGHASVRSFHRAPDARFQVQRMAYPGDLPTSVQYVSGLEILKRFVRR